MKCKFCDKPCDGLRGLSAHERRCSGNPDNKEVHGDGSTQESLFAVDRCNFPVDVKEAFRVMISQYGWNYQECKEGSVKYRNIKNNCEKLDYRADFKLSLLEYLLKMIAAGIKPNQIGKRLDSYQLCRKNDIGSYEGDNCFFDTFENNLKTQQGHMDYSERDYSWTKTAEFRAKMSESAKKQWSRNNE